MPDDASTFTFGKFLILIGDGNSPQEFSDPCGVTSRGFNRTAQMNDTNIPKCTAPDDPSWLGRDIVSMAVDMPFAGVVAAESYDMWDDWFQGGLTKDVRVELANEAGVTLAAWDGRAKLQNLNWAGARGQRMTFSSTLVSDGAFTRDATPLTQP